MAKKSDWDDESTSEIRVSLMPVSMEAKPYVLQMVQGPGAPRDYELALGQVISAYNAVAPPPPLEPPDPDDRLRRGTSTATSR